MGELGVCDMEESSMSPGIWPGLNTGEELKIGTAGLAWGEGESAEVFYFGHLGSKCLWSVPTGPMTNYQKRKPCMWETQGVDSGVLRRFSLCTHFCCH